MKTDKREADRTHSKARSPHWRTVEKAHLKIFPNCACCDRKKGVEVHHKMPFHDHPERELDMNNLITLCREGTDCHLFVGHAGDFKGYNPHVVEDAAAWAAKFRESRALAKAHDVA